MLQEQRVDLKETDEKHNADDPEEGDILLEIFAGCQSRDRSIFV